MRLLHLKSISNLVIANIAISRDVFRIRTFTSCKILQIVATFRSLLIIKGDLNSIESIL